MRALLLALKLAPLLRLEPRAFPSYSSVKDRAQCIRVRQCLSHLRGRRVPAATAWDLEAVLDLAWSLPSQFWGGGAGDARHFATTINTTIHEHMFPLRNSLTLQLPSSHAHHSGPHHCHANSHTRNCSRRQALEAPPWSLRRPILPTLILMIPSQTQESSGLPCGSQHPKHEAVLALVAQVVELKPQHKQLPGT